MRGLCVSARANQEPLGAPFLNAQLTAAAAGVAIVTAMLERDLLPKVQSQGDHLMAALNAVCRQHPHIGEIRGRGLFQRVEFVADRETKAPLDASRKIAARIKSAAFEAGLICYPMSGTIDGRQGDHLLLAPPFIISDAQIHELVTKLSGAVETALS